MGGWGKRVRCFQPGSGSHLATAAALASRVGCARMHIDARPPSPLSSRPLSEGEEEEGGTAPGKADSPSSPLRWLHSCAPRFHSCPWSRVVAEQSLAGGVG